MSAGAGSPTGVAPVLATADVVVVGGGPAGAACALLLARIGARAVLVHDPDSEAGRPLVGEVLPPAARPAFERLGLGSLLDDRAHATVPGFLSTWGPGEPDAIDHLWSPYGDAVQVERARLVGALRVAAVEAGAALVRAPRRAWRWLAALEGPPVVVDASGRAASVARSAGAAVERADRLVAVVGVLDRDVGRRAALRQDERRVLVATAPEGWWSSMVLPDGRRVAALHTDSDLLSASVAREPPSWFARLQEVQLIGRAVAAGGWVAPGRLAVLAADSRRLVEAGPSGAPRARSRATPVIVAAGDADMAFHPLTSMGILAAITSAEEAAEVAAARAGSGPGAAARATRARAEARARRWRRYLDRIALSYATETRWPDAPFWSRRALPVG